MKNILAVLLCLISFSTVIGFDEPDGFKGLKWGASVEQFKKQFGGWKHMASDTYDGKTTDLYSVTGQTVGDVIVNVHFNFLNNRFIGVTITFNSGNFDYLERAFMQKYGKPDSQSNTPLQTTSGAKFVNHEIAWNGQSIFISLEKYGSSIDRGYGVIGKKSSMKEASEIKNRRVKDPAKDL